MLPWSIAVFTTARKRSLRRLCFHRCLFSTRRGEYLGEYPPRQVQPPWPGTPPGQVPPGRYTPLGRYTPKAGTPPGQVHPLAGTPPGHDTSPRAGTPLLAGTPPGQVHPLPGRYTHTGHSACLDMVNKRAGTHPTGMHSCSRSKIIQQCLIQVILLMLHFALAGFGL